MSEFTEGRRRSKRNRLLAFDISRISVQPQSKQRKYKNPENMSHPMQVLDPSIVDMSYTINEPNPSTSAAARSVANAQPPNTNEILNRSEEVDTMIRDMVNESISETQLNLQKMVQDSVSKEMGKVYAAIGKINEAVMSLTNTQSNNNRNTENQTETARTSSDCPSSSPPPTYRENGGNANIQNNITPGIMNIGGYKGIKVERFGLNFTGNPNSLPVEDFIYRLEYFQKHYKLSWDEILNEFHILVSGPAYEWFWLQQRSNNVSSWPALKHALIERFKTRRTCFEEMRDLLERKQMPGESIDSFFHDLNLMRSKLERPVSEFEMINLAKKNLRKSLSSIVYSMQVSSLEQLRVECLEVERTFFKREPVQPISLPNKPMRVSAVQEESDDGEILELTDDNDEIAAVNSNIICWNCHNPGHLFKDCPSSQRSLFCFKCGKPNTISPKCVNCRSGNTRKNVVAAGNHRSADQPATSKMNI